MYSGKSKSRRHDFHESYYEHSCAIIDEKDVLENDIPGRSYSARLKRWWHGLFLLSYRDKMNRIFYTSSHAMRIERMRHFRKFRGRIHPLSQFRNVWNFLMLNLFVLNKLIFHHNSSITYGQMCNKLYYLGPIIEIVIIIDIFLNMKTGYIDHEARKVILEKFDGLVHYGSTKLFIHVASAIPLQWIMFLRYGVNIDCDLCKTNKFITALKVINVFGLLRVYESSSYWTRERSNYKLSFFFKLLRICVLGFLTMLQIIDFSENFILQIMIANGEIDESSYMTLLIIGKFVVENPMTAYEFMLLNFARICKAVLLFGFSFKRQKFYLDIMAALCAYIIANLFYVWLVLECYNFIYCISFSEDQVIAKKKVMDNMVRCRQLPDRITRKLRKYYDFHQSKMKTVEHHNCLYKSLPNTLKREIVLATYNKFVKRISYFSDWPPRVIEGIVFMLKEESFLSDEMVAEPWVESEGLMIVAMGELAVYSKDVETGHLIDGDYFGELSLVTNKELRSSSVVAISSCVILLMEKGQFRTYMRQYPDLFFALKQELKDKHRKAANIGAKDNT